MQASEWKVIFLYGDGARTSHVVAGFLPLLHAVRYARATPGIRVVEVGPKIGPIMLVLGIA